MSEMLLPLLQPLAHMDSVFVLLFFFFKPTLNLKTPSSANFDFRLLSSCGFFCAIVSSAHASLVLVPLLSFKTPNSTAWWESVLRHLIHQLA